MVPTWGEPRSAVGVPNYDFSHRRVLVAGGARGLGLQAARGFAASGAQVVVSGTNSLTAYYDSDLTAFDYVQLDLTDEASIAEVAAHVGPVDVLVNAAAPRLSPTIDPSEREFVTEAVRLALVGPLQLATRLRLRLAQSHARGGGSVINLPAIKGWFDLTHGPSLAGDELVAVTSAMGQSWGRQGVRVNSICAPLEVPLQVSGLQVQIEPRSGPLLTRTRQRVSTTMREVADLTLFLASSGAAGVTGHTLHVGGVTHRSND